MRSLAPLLLLAVFPSIDGAHAAEPDCAVAVAERVQRHYDGVRDLRASFEQRTERASLGGAASEALVARGEVVFAKPGKMRWTYDSPEPSVVVSDGETLWIWDEKAREVQKMALGAGPLSNAGVQFLLGDARLDAEFEIRAKECTEPSVTLSLVPRHDAQYERIELSVDPKSGVVTETVVVDLFGNRTTVAMRQVRENDGAKATDFRFAVPAGARVIEAPTAP
jgi:outer membrane lipoprotein carrier protein